MNVRSLAAFLQTYLKFTQQLESLGKVKLIHLKGLSLAVLGTPKL